MVNEAESVILKMPLRAVCWSWIGLIQRRNLGPVWAMASQLVTSFGNFLTSIIIVRELGLTEFGRFSVAFLILMIVRNFLNGVILTPMAVIAPKLRPMTAPAYRGFLLMNGLGFSIAMSMTLYLLSCVVGGLVGWPWLIDVALALAFANLSNNMADYFRRYEFVRVRPAHAFWIDGVRYIIQLGLLGMLAVSWREGLTPESALLMVALGGTAGCFFGAMIYGKVCVSSALNRAMWPRHWKFVKWMTPSVALDSIQSSAPLFIGTALMGEAALGGVRAVQQLANILSLPTNAMQQVAPSMAARRFQQGGLRSMARLLIILLCIAAVVLLVSTGAVIALWEPVCDILFKSRATELFFIYILYSVLNIESLLRQMLYIFFQSSENPRVVTESGVIGAIITVVSVFFLEPYMKTGAIPMSSVIANTAVVTLLIYRVNQAFARQKQSLTALGKI